MPTLAGPISGSAFDNRGTSNPRASRHWLLPALPLLLVTFMPRPELPAAHLLVYPAAAAILYILALQLLREDLRFSRPIVAVLMLLLALNATTAVSFTVNSAELRNTALLQLLRPGVFAVFLVFGYSVAATYGPQVVAHGLVIGAIITVLGQAVITVFQLAGLPLFDVLYSADKTRPIGSLVRATGSLANPNTFAWIVAQAAIVAYSGTRQWRWVWLLAGGILVLSSGSRTVLLLYPFMVVLTNAWRGDSGWLRLLGRFVFAGTILVLILWLVASAANVLPYLGQLRQLMTSGSLEAVPSIGNRFEHWRSTFTEFSAGGVRAVLVGLGSRETLRVMDNDYLYVLFRLGAVGLIGHLAVIAFALHVFRRAPRELPTVVGGQYVISALVLGLVFETHGGWYFPLLMYALLGMSAAFIQRPVAGNERGLRGAKCRGADHRRRWTLGSMQER